MTKRSQDFESQIGSRNGFLVISEYHGLINGVHTLKCLCDCGKEHLVSSSNLKRTKSCGCSTGKILSELFTKEIDIELAVSLYHEGIALHEIASRVGISYTGLRRKLEKENLVKREPVYITPSKEDSHRWKGGRVGDGHGYIACSSEHHPRKRAKGDYVKEHILVMEKHIGRPLLYISKGHPDNEVVHHVNKDRSDNRIENLQLMTHKAHTSFHSKEMWVKIRSDEIIRKAPAKRKSKQS